MDKDYHQLMEDLRQHNIESFTITKDEFQTFQPIFHVYEYRQQLVGKANRGGEIEYTLLEKQA